MVHEARICNVGTLTPHSSRSASRGSGNSWLTSTYPSRRQSQVGSSSRSVEIHQFLRYSHFSSFVREAVPSLFAARCYCYGFFGVYDRTEVRSPPFTCYFLLRYPVTTCARSFVCFGIERLAKGQSLLVVRRDPKVFRQERMFYPI